MFEACVVAVPVPVRCDDGSRAAGKAIADQVCLPDNFDVKFCKPFNRFVDRYLEVVFGLLDDRVVGEVLNDSDRMLYEAAARTNIRRTNNE